MEQEHTVCFHVREPVARLRRRQRHRRERDGFYQLRTQAREFYRYQSAAFGTDYMRAATAKFADEATLFRLAAQLEKEAPWAARRPQVWG